MVRAKRAIASSGMYHVMVRGAGRQNIFNDDHDRLAFLQLLQKMVRRHSVVLLAWCLMDNHVHLLLRDDGDCLVSAMHYLDSRYAQYFNARTGHIGPVFQDRFTSKPIENAGYFLQAVRYIHNNPCSFGCSREDYKWSSYHAYADGSSGFCSELVDCGPLLGELGGAINFEEFSAGGDDDLYAPFCRRRLGPEEISEAVRVALRGRDPRELGSLSLAERNEGLKRMRALGISVREMERLTGLGRKLIQRISEEPRSSGTIRAGGE